MTTNQTQNVIGQRFSKIGIRLWNCKSRLTWFEPLFCQTLLVWLYRAYNLVSCRFVLVSVYIVVFERWNFIITWNAQTWHTMCIANVNMIVIDHTKHLSGKIFYIVVYFLHNILHGLFTLGAVIIITTCNFCTCNYTESRHRNFFNHFTTFKIISFTNLVTLN